MGSHGQQTGFFNTNLAGSDRYDTNYLKLIQDNQQAQNEIKMFRNNLAKSEEISKNLKIENEFLLNQLEILK